MPLTNLGNYFHVHDNNIDTLNQHVTQIANRLRVPDHVWFLDEEANPQFQERTRLIQTLDEKLFNNQILVVLGERHVGKKQVVLQYIRKYNEKFDKNVTWIDGNISLQDTFYKIAVELGVMTGDGNTSRHIFQVLTDINNDYFKNKKCLIVFNNIKQNEVGTYLEKLKNNNIYIILIINDDNAGVWEGVQKLKIYHYESEFTFQKNQNLPENIWLLKENLRPRQNLEGREDDLCKLDGLINRHKRVVVLGDPFECHPVGKTQFVLKYAYENKFKFDNNMIWINAGNDIEHQLKEVVKILGISREDINLVLHDIKYYFHSRKGLVIFDNAKYKVLNKYIDKLIADNIYIIITAKGYTSEWSDNKYLTNMKIDHYAAEFLAESRMDDFISNFLD